MKKNCRRVSMTYSRNIAIRGLTDAVRKCMREKGKRMTTKEIYDCLEKNPSLNLSKIINNPQRKSRWKSSVRRTLRTLVQQKEIKWMGDATYVWNKQFQYQESRGRPRN